MPNLLYLSDKQIRQEIRLSSVDLNLKKIVFIDIFSQLKQDTFLCSFMFILCYVGLSQCRNFPCGNFERLNSMVLSTVLHGITAYTVGQKSATNCAISPT